MVSEKDLIQKDGDILKALELFVSGVAKEVTRSKDFGVLVGPLMQDYFSVHMNDVRTFDTLQDEEQLKSRYLRIIYKLEPAVEFIGDAESCPLPVTTRTRLLTLYKNFRNACAEKCSIPTGQER